MSFNTQFAKLMDLNGVTAEMISDATGLKKSTIQQWRRPCCRLVPSIKTLKILADYFMVSLDTLLDRQNLNDWYGDIDNYRRIREMCRFYNYTEFLKNNMISHHVCKTAYDENGKIDYTRFELPYPYNLAYDIQPDLAEHVFCLDQLKGIGAALKWALSDGERGIISLYYEDGMTLDEIGKKMFLTRERIRQIIQKSLKKLRAPLYKNCIICGYEGVEKLRREALEKRREAYLAELLMDGGTKPVKPLFEDICDWDLSVRAYNCLTRGQLETKDKVIEAFKNGDIFKVRNLGIKTLREIRERVETLFGKEVLQ